jgi:hypothetical protein
MARGCPAGVGSILLPPAGAGALGWKQREKPRIAEPKKANAGPKGGTLAHTRRHVASFAVSRPKWLPPAKNADVGATFAKSGKGHPTKSPARLVLRYKL